MKLKDKITIVVPCKNEEDYICHLLDSLRTQNIDDTRVIIADCSTDNTRQVIKDNSFGLNVEIIDGGPVSIAKNNGARLVITPYILFIDADVRFFKNTVIQDSVNKIESTYRISKDSPTGTSYGSYIRQSGIAEWAVLFDFSMLEGTTKLLEFDSNTNRLNFLRNITENDLFMIVPVSDAAGAGVLRFNTVTFDNSNKVIKKFTLNFS